MTKLYQTNCDCTTPNSPPKKVGMLWKHPSNNKIECVHFLNLWHQITHYRCSSSISAAYSKVQTSWSLRRDWIKNWQDSGRLGKTSVSKHSLMLHSQTLWPKFWPCEAQAVNQQHSEAPNTVCPLVRVLNRFGNFWTFELKVGKDHPNW